MTVPGQFERVPCESCGSADFSPIRRWNGVSDIVRCLQCGLRFVNPLPDEDYLRRLYEEDLRGQGDASAYYLTYIRERMERRASYEKQYRSRLKLIERFAPERGRLLDVGCGGGFFLQTAQARGWTPHGIDVVPEFIRFAREELNIEAATCAPLAENRFAAETFDVVTLWDLIEHLRKPLDCLREINRILRPGGQVVIWTPNAENAVYAKARWYGYNINQHLYFLSSRTLGRLLARAGFRKVFEQTSRAKKGFFPRLPPVTYDKAAQPASGAEKIWRGIKRDVKNAFNPVNYLSPILDRAGYGFNLLVIARKTGDAR
ncbi:MAG: class I SAM-dependent methyltransferase [Nitrospinales bacterium]